MALSPREQRFVDVYSGNGVEACRTAGYKGNANVLHVQAARLLRKATVKEAIRARTAKESKAAIHTRQYRQAFWSKQMDDETATLRDRLRASELLGRSEADFTEKLEIKGELTLEALVRGSHEKPEPT